MSHHIDLSPETLMNQATMTANEYMCDAVGRIDALFHEGYAAKNPALVGAFMQAAAHDFCGAIMAENLLCGLEQIAQSIELIAQRLDKED